MNRAREASGAQNNVKEEPKNSFDMGGGELGRNGQSRKAGNYLYLRA